MYVCILYKITYVIHIHDTQYHVSSSKLVARILFPELFEGRKQNRKRNIKDPPFRYIMSV